MSFVTPFLATIGGGSALLGGASVALTGYQFYQSRKQAKQQEAVGRQNQELAEVEAKQAEVAALDRIRIRRDQIRKDVGQQRASFAASGVVVSEGSPLLAYAETVDNGIKDMEAIEEQGRLDAWRARMGGQIANQQARNLASSTRREGLFNLATSALSMGSGFLTPMSAGGGSASATKIS